MKWWVTNCQFLLNISSFQRVQILCVCDIRILRYIYIWLRCICKLNLTIQSCIYFDYSANTYYLLHKVAPNGKISCMDCSLQDFKLSMNSCNINHSFHHYICKEKIVMITLFWSNIMSSSLDVSVKGEILPYQQNLVSNNCTTGCIRMFDFV